ncbi:MAG: N-acetyltransferase [Caulobacter sp.]|nr:N-acetyltransferase [Caulobacter sp.]
MADPDLLPVIDTDRLRLRGWRLSDAAALAANLTPEVTRWLASWPDPVTSTVAVARLAKARADAVAGTEAAWGVILRSDGLLIGGIGFHVGGFKPDAPDAHTRAEVGYHIGPAFHGQGYMTEAGVAALEAAWRLLPTVMTIEGGVLPGNAGSEAVLTKMGLKRSNNRIIYSAARRVDELCHCYEIERPH